MRNEDGTEPHTEGRSGTATASATLSAGERKSNIMPQSPTRYDGTSEREFLLHRRLQLLEMRKIELEIERVQDEIRREKLQRPEMQCAESMASCTEDAMVNTRNGVNGPVTPAVAVTADREVEWRSTMTQSRHSTSPHAELDHTHTASPADAGHAYDSTKGMNTHSSSSESAVSCVACDQGCALLSDCRRFRAMEIAERNNIVHNGKLCRNCLQSHKGACQFKGCGESKCTGKHQPLLHKNYDEDRERTNRPADSQGEHEQASRSHNTKQSTTNATLTTHCDTHASTAGAPLPHAPVTLHRKASGMHTFAQFVDGSSSTLRNHELLADFGLTDSPRHLCSPRTGNTTRDEVDSVDVCLKISGKHESAKVYRMPGVRTVRSLLLPAQTLEPEKLAGFYAHLNGAPTALYVNVRPRLLIGVEHCHHLTTPKIFTHDELAAAERLLFVLVQAEAFPSEVAALKGKRKTSPKLASPIEFSDQATLSLPEGHKDGSGLLDNALGGALGGHVFGAQHIQQLQVIQRLQQQRAAMLAARAAGGQQGQQTGTAGQPGQPDSQPSSTAPAQSQQQQVQAQQQAQTAVCTECAECAECAAKQMHDEECDSQCSDDISPMLEVPLPPHAALPIALVPLAKASPERRVTAKKIIAGEERPKFLTIKQVQDSSAQDNEGGLTAVPVAVTGAGSSVPMSSKVAQDYSYCSSSNSSKQLRAGQVNAGADANTTAQHQQQQQQLGTTAEADKYAGQRYKPPAAFDDSPAAVRSSWKAAQQNADQFWRLWVKSYLPLLARRSKWDHRTRPIEIGDIVVIVDDTLPRNRWTKGRVLSTVQAADGQVRRATIQTAQRVLERPATKIAVLDVRARGS